MINVNTFSILLFFSLHMVVTTAGAEVIFSDSFESGDLLSTNADKFEWIPSGENDRISIVTQDPDDGPVSIFTSWEGRKYQVFSPKLPDGTPREYAAQDGKNSLRFKYQATGKGDDSAFVEQEFDMKKGYPEVWISYWIRVPMNYKRTGSGSNRNSNNKWMIFGMNSKSNLFNYKSTFVEVKDRPSTVPYSMSMQLQVSNRGTQFTPESQPYQGFVTPTDSGRWMQVIFHFKASSKNGARDGLVKMYRRWKGDANFEYITGYENIDCDISNESIAAGYNGWGAGYLMGYHNDEYAVETEWLIDDFVISTTPLLPNAPLPPSGINVVVK